MGNNDDSDDEQHSREPRRYSLNWDEEIRPDEADMKYETVGDD